MDINPKLCLNGNPKECDNNSLIYANNIRVDNNNLSLIAEQSIIENNTINDKILNFGKNNWSITSYELLGFIECNKEIVLFVFYKPSVFTDDKIFIFRYNEDNNIITFSCYTDVFSTYLPKIKGVYTYNYKNELIISFTQINDEYLYPLKTINLGKFNIEDNATDETNLLNNPDIHGNLIKLKIPEINYNYVYGNAYKGWYFVYIRYKYNDYDYSQWLSTNISIFTDSSKNEALIDYIAPNEVIDNIPAPKTVLIDEYDTHINNKGNAQYISTSYKRISDNTDISNVSFNLTINHLSTKYKKFQLGFIINSKTYTKCYRTIDIDVNSETENDEIVYKNNIIFNKNILIEYNLKDILQKYIIPYNVKNIINKNNNIYIANYIEKSLLHVHSKGTITVKCYETEYLRNSDLKKDSSINYDNIINIIDPNEYYSFYIHFVDKYGNKSKGYPLYKYTINQDDTNTIIFEQIESDKNIYKFKSKSDSDYLKQYYESELLDYKSNKLKNGAYLEFSVDNNFINGNTGVCFSYEKLEKRSLYKGVIYYNVKNNYLKFYSTQLNYNDAIKLNFNKIRIHRYLNNSQSTIEYNEQFKLQHITNFTESVVNENGTLKVNTPYVVDYKKFIINDDIITNLDPSNTPYLTNNNFIKNNEITYGLDKDNPEIYSYYTSLDYCLNKSNNYYNVLEFNINNFELVVDDNSFIKINISDSDMEEFKKNVLNYSHKLVNQENEPIDKYGNVYQSGSEIKFRHWVFFQAYLINDNINNFYNNQDKELIPCSTVCYKNDQPIVINTRTAFVTNVSTIYNRQCKLDSNIYVYTKKLEAGISLPQLINFVYTDLLPLPEESLQFNNKPNIIVTPYKGVTENQYKKSFVNNTIIEAKDTLDLFKMPYEPIYDIYPDYLTNVKDTDTEYTHINNKRINRSAVLSTETLENRWHDLPIENYKDILENKGSITNLISAGYYLLVHTEHSLFMFDTNNTLTNNENNNIQLANTDLFDLQYKEVFTSNLGYGGLQDYKFAIFDQFGYIFYNNDNNSFYQFDNNNLNIIDEDIKQWLYNNKIVNGIFAHDKNNNRLLINFICSDNSRKTLSYNYKYKSFISFHDFNFDNAIHTKNKLYFIKNNKIYQFVDNKYNKFDISDNDNKTYNSKISIIIKGNNYENIKYLEFIKYNLHKKEINNSIPLLIDNLYKYITNYSGDKLRIYNRNIDTGVIDINVDTDVIEIDENITNEIVQNDLKNYKIPYYDLGNWNFNYLRDVRNIKNIDEQLDTNSRLYGNYFILEFEFLHDNNKTFELENINYGLIER